MVTPLRLWIDDCDACHLCDFAKGTISSYKIGQSSLFVKINGYSQLQSIEGAQCPFGRVPV